MIKKQTKKFRQQLRKENFFLQVQKPILIMHILFKQQLYQGLMKLISGKNKNNYTPLSLKKSTKRQQLVLTVCTMLPIQPCKSQTPKNENKNDFLPNCCEVLIDKEKTEAEMPKKYHTKPQAEELKLDLLEEYDMRSSSFTLKTYAPNTNQSHQNSCLWNPDSPVNKLYD